MPKLTDTQIIILNTAASRDSRAILPLPKSLKVNKGTATSVLKAMAAKGLIEEQPAGPGVELWRNDGDGRGFMLVLTEAGFAALDGGPTDKAPKPQPAKAAKRAATVNVPVGSPPRGGKAFPTTSTISSPSSHSFSFCPNDQDSRMAWLLDIA